jgi:two-component system, LuxR family, response regulator FixJ
MNSEATIFIVDDDIAMRDSLSLLLSLNGFRTRSFANAENALTAYSPDWLGCMLVDMRMPGMSGLELQIELGKRGGDLPIVVMTAYGDIAMARAVLKSGAADFLEKPIDDAVLIDVLRAAIEVQSRRRQALPAIPGVGRPQPLTMREQQVMEFVAAGLPVREIAERLGISPRTVEVYKSRMTQKLRSHDAKDLPNPKPSGGTS